MKKIISSVLVCVLLLGCAFTLASCGKTLSGEYESTLGTTTYAFSGKNVTVTYEIFGFTKTIEGTYEITVNDEEEEIIIFTFPSDAEDADDYAGEYSFVEGTEGDDEYIKIAGIKYTKKAE
ncbi:MAG: hypothetical protein J6Q68_01165 [Clostridia bacterium]|nr:hypothetical protein [Clostridia bacterium]